MTSLEWSAGNIYGSYKEPPYNILSYTWGRWECLDAPSLTVKGVSWKIPAVCETHFSLDSFSQVIRRVSRSVLFVWIDMACIDQENRAAMMDEIGKQVGIFQRADQAFIWLSHHSTSALQESVNSLYYAAQNIDDLVGGISKSQKEARDEDESRTMSLQSLSDLLAELLGDPWFSSLWTLQEAFLRKDAILLTQESSTITFPASRTGRPSYLNDLISSCSRIYRTLQGLQERILSQQSPPRAHLHALIDEVMLRIDNAGFNSLHADNPIMLYGVARFRETTHPLDRVYAIMQVFGLRLGESAQPERSFTLAELEDQLGDALATRSPLLSQLFVHVCPPPCGRSWRIGQYSRVPEAARTATSEYSAHAGTSPESWAEIVVGRGGATVRGQACSFEMLVEFWRVASFHPERLDLVGRRPHCPVQHIQLDVSCWAGGAGLPALDPKNDHRQHQLGELMVSKFNGCLMTVMLGKLIAIARGYESDTITTWVGLILKRETIDKKEVWQRIGICFWDSVPRRIVPEQDKIWFYFEGVLW